MTIPFNVLVMSELIPGGREISAPLGPFYPEKGIGPILDELSPRLMLRISPWQGREQGRSEVAIDLSFNDVKSFRPRAVAGQIPGLSLLSGLIQAAQEIKAGRSSRDALVPHVKEITGITVRPSGPDAGHAVGMADSRRGIKEDALSSLLDLVDTDGGVRAHQPGGPLVGCGLMDLLAEAGDFVYGHGTSGMGLYLSRLINAAHCSLDSCLQEVYGNRRFRGLESAWMGLKFLMDRTPGSTDVRFYCLPACGEEAVSLAEDFGKRVWPRQQGLAPSMIVWDQEIDAGPPGINLLKKIAALAHEYMVPVVAAADLSLFLVEDWDEFERLPYLPSRLSEPGYGAWQGICSSDTARWVALGFNPMLLRPLYNRDYVRDRFLFCQHPDQALWGRPVWGIAALTVLGFTVSGWPYLPTGPGGIVLEDLPIISEADGPLPLRYEIPEGRAVELHDCGLSPLVCTRGTDRAWAFAGPVLHGSINRSDPVVRSQCTLTYQLFVSRFLRLVEAAKKILPSGISDRDLSLLLEDTIKSWTGNRGVRVEILHGAGERTISITLDEVPHISRPSGLSIQVPFPG